ncbi:hypothetical protein [Streptomyces puniciscabiei]|uniref:hypothetical protein n=1 Tax=Streptomyces puniciscabiei TaxID=164348 RepID=UPI00379B83A6
MREVADNTSWKMGWLFATTLIFFPAGLLTDGRHVRVRRLAGIGETDEIPDHHTVRRVPGRSLCMTSNSAALPPAEPTAWRLGRPLLLRRSSLLYRLFTRKKLLGAFFGYVLLRSEDTGDKSR